MCVCDYYKIIDHPGKCWDENLETAFDIGTHQPKGKCMEISCNKQFDMAYKTCVLLIN